MTSLKLTNEIFFLLFDSLDQIENKDMYLINFSPQW